ncbi:MAG: hypothetical protein A3H50_01085 [Candidatus Levybacteria bacterium RIFCSPLOWO2_02_FULL_37_10]|nr:MAG: hypothetical protein A2860_04000 [Candidatus Levybacteria bacterium RIFCSPHIGHO2_01_FULL_37_33]OGH30045.1 MAG: hypothetical protein A3F30_04160 [Candidatus Levybacteria bacterium RIFCSPHIGHO2_12_FULL_37_12]OGH43244.1 MAG: hypothetical protein A3H50_01085 [Candidatus Levybacteria bacterium RIFCSPLOWO2_02_FULL_37_10]
MDKKDYKEKSYPKRRDVFELRFYNEKELLKEVFINSNVNKTFVKKIISCQVAKLWDGESTLKLDIKVIYKGKTWF